MNHVKQSAPRGVQVLVLPGWQNSDAQHWQTRWQERWGYTRVQQHDWQRPLRGDWSAQLQEAVLDSPQPVVLVAHSLGCILTAWWAAHSPLARTKVRGALLVAPPDVAAEPLCHILPGWLPVAQQALPFASVVVASSTDPYCSLTRAHTMAQHWGAQWVEAGALGHINSASGVGDWEAGHHLLENLMKDEHKPW